MNTLRSLYRRFLRLLLNRPQPPDVILLTRKHDPPKPQQRRVW